MNRIVPILIGLLVVLGIASTTLFVVDQRQYAVVFALGEIKQVSAKPGLHFELCYYQGIEHCIRNGLKAFEPGAQGEHKMARALLPVKTTSAHWLANPSFADAVDRYLEREGQGIAQYMDELQDRNPLKARVA